MDVTDMVILSRKWIGYQWENDRLIKNRDKLMYEKYKKEKKKLIYKFSIKRNMRRNNNIREVFRNH